jgi:hypothetical protein
MGGLPMQDTVLHPIEYRCYLAEAVIKTLAIVLYAGLRKKAPDHAYKIGYELVRFDGLETWDSPRACRCWGDGTNSGRMTRIIHPPMPPRGVQPCVSNSSSSCAAKMAVKKR